MPVELKRYSAHFRKEVVTDIYFMAETPEDAKNFAVTITLNQNEIGFGEMLESNSESKGWFFETVGRDDG